MPAVSCRHQENLCSSVLTRLRARSGGTSAEFGTMALGLALLGRENEISPGVGIVHILIYPSREVPNAIKVLGQPNPLQKQLGNKIFGDECGTGIPNPDQTCSEERPANGLTADELGVVRPRSTEASWSIRPAIRAGRQPKSRIFNRNVWRRTESGYIH